jgi:hypothetical protein
MLKGKKNSPGQKVRKEVLTRVVNDEFECSRATLYWVNMSVEHICRIFHNILRTHDRRQECMIFLKTF